MSETLRLGENPKKLDLDIIENGVRKEAPMAPGVFFRVLPWGTHNPRYKKAIQARALTSPKREKLAEGDVDASNDFVLSRQEDPEFIVDAVVADIEGLLNEKGNAVQFTRERGVRILGDPEWAHLRDWVVGTSIITANTYKEDVETDAGN